MSWKGYPSLAPKYVKSETKENTIADFKTLLHRVGWNMLRTDGSVVPWSERYDCLRRPTYDAYGKVGFCGVKSGHAYDCTNGCRVGMPFGCSDKWCCHCEGCQSVKRAGKILDRFNRILQGTEFVCGRIGFTVGKENNATAGSLSGSKKMVRQAFKTLCEVHKIGPEKIAAMGTFHPTSSDFPWNKHPHVELLYVHAKIDSEGMDPLPIGEDGILSKQQLDLLKKKWGARYPQSKNIHVSYVPELSLRFINYLVRSMIEDVWYALDQGRLKIDRSKDELGLDPITIPPEAEAGLRADGGVTFWKNYRRPVYFGAMSDRHFNRLMESLDKPPIVHPKGIKECPCCEGGELTLERDEEGPVTVSFSPHDPFDGPIMFTNGKTNTKTGD